jgi:hypothetical protein
LIFICQRRHLDWAAGDADVLARADSWLRPVIELWNETFTVSYAQFRHRVSQIAELNWSSVGGASRTAWEEIPAGSLVLPVDDDDWFSPHLPERLQREGDQRALGYFWRSEWIEVPLTLGHRGHLIRRRFVPGTAETWTCSTNNYAFVKGTEAEGSLERHTRASRWFDACLAEDPRTIKRLPGALSVANRTLASQTSLGLLSSPIDRQGLIRRYRRYRRLYRARPPRRLAWAAPYIAMTSELMDELEPREVRYG